MIKLNSTCKGRSKKKVRIEHNTNSEGLQLLHISCYQFGYLLTVVLFLYDKSSIISFYAWSVFCLLIFFSPFHSCLIFFGDTEYYVCLPFHDYFCVWMKYIIRMYIHNVRNASSKSNVKYGKYVILLFHFKIQKRTHMNEHEGIRRKEMCSWGTELCRWIMI